MYNTKSQPASDQSTSNRGRRNMPPRHKQKEKEQTDNKNKEKKRMKLSNEEKEDKRSKERMRKLNSNTVTFLADINRVIRRTKMKQEGYNRATAFKLFNLLTKVFKKVEECDRQKLLKITEELQETTKRLKNAIQNLESKKETETTNTRQHEEEVTDSEEQDTPPSMEHQTAIVTTAEDPHIADLEELNRTYCNYYNIKTEGENSSLTPNDYHTNPYGFSNSQGDTDQADCDTDHIHVFQAVNKTEVSDQSEADFYHTMAPVYTPGMVHYWTDRNWTADGGSEN